MTVLVLTYRLRDIGIIEVFPEIGGRNIELIDHFFFFFFNNFTFIDKTYITVAKFKTKRKYITILQIASKLHKDEKE